MSVGLLGGSFNPAHRGHLDVARRSLADLGLDEVWLLVSPGNPLKSRDGMAPFARRLESARALTRDPRIIATDIEARLGQRYTVRTVALLKRRFPRVRFVWLMGADGLVQFPRWRRWRRIAHLVPIAVLPRPGFTMKALHGAAASVLRHGRVPDAAARRLAALGGGHWAFLPGPQDGISATELRARAARA